MAKYESVPKAERDVENSEFLVREEVLLHEVWEKEQILP